MLGKIRPLIAISALGFAISCQTATAPSNSNSAANGSSQNNTAANNANIPPEFSGKPIEMNGATPTPGIPDPKLMNANSIPKGATPTPGIPDPKMLGKPLPKGATPTPGIPDPETIKKQMNTPVDANAVNASPKSSTANKP